MTIIRGRGCGIVQELDPYVTVIDTTGYARKGSSDQNKAQCILLAGDQPTF